MPGTPPESPPEPNEIAGSIHAVVFHNEENGFTIFQAQTDLSIDLVTVLGILPAAVQGENFKATGKWQQNHKFGKQFKADIIHPLPPETPDAIEQFLASGFIDGIGKRYAKRIVRKFGKDTFDVIENESQRLEMVEGVGKKRRMLIKDSWNKQKSVRDIMIFLTGHGLSPARATRLYKEYGARAVHVLRQNPYQLVRDLPGVGFKTADDIARKMGQADNSPERITAGIHYVIEAAAGKGHCALPREELIAQGMTVLQAEHPLVESVLDDLLRDGQLVIEEIAGVPLVFSIELSRAEISVAASIKEYVIKEVTYPELNPEKAIQWFEESNGFSLGEEQAAAVKGAMENRVFIITGGPGVGKTTILNAILQILAKKNIEPVLCAPTGRAAKRLNESTGREASTIHRLLEFQPGGGFSRSLEKRLEGDLFVVDEASMIDIKLMADFLEALPEKAHLILVGDVDQLPSVGAGTVLRDLIDSEVLPVARLTRIFRQAEASRIISAAHAINQGQKPEIDNLPDSDFFFIERQGANAIVDTLKHLIRERIPNKFGFDSRDEIQVLTPMNRNTLGTKNLNAELQAAVNPPAPQKSEVERFGNIYRTGDKVIQTRNNYDNEVFNGDIGYIREIADDPVLLTVVFDNEREVNYEPGDLDELQLAYAITIHKSQGSEFPAVIIPLASEQFILLQRNLIYTGLTRGKKLVIFVGEMKALEMAIRNQDSNKRWTGLKWRLQQK